MVKENYRICFGGWYQRTTLHLTELYFFLLRKYTRLKLSKAKLNVLYNRLNIKSVERKVGYLEYIKIITNSGIEIRYYEDGLYILEMNSKEIEKSKEKIKDYFHKRLRPMIEYLFSLGAPTPKILANIKEEHPVVIGITRPNINSLKIDEKKFGRIYSKTSSKNARVIKTLNYILVITSIRNEDELRDLIEMQIFFKEFKVQLHKYLNIHRKIWEEIDEIKERKEIRGKDVDEYMDMLYSYKKTIEIIKYRIGQMEVYAGTREKLSKKLKIEKKLIDLFEYRFEDLFSTLDYIKEIWGLTLDYVKDGIKVMDGIEAKTSQGGIRSIQLLASIGVVTGFLGYLTEQAFPKISYIGVIYFGALMAIALTVDRILTGRTKNKKYKVKFIEREKEI